jgi:membrane protease YdiL (CAAX protease family)
LIADRLLTVALPFLQTFLPLLVLGMVFSCVFLLTRNLLPPIVLHSFWNVFVLSRLT